MLNYNIQYKLKNTVKYKNAINNLMLSKMQIISEVQHED